MPLVPELIEKLQRHPKRIVFPEGSDPRILQAARQLATKRMGVPVLLGRRAQIKRHAALLDIQLQGIRIVEPERSDEYEECVHDFFELRKEKGMTMEMARTTMSQTSYFAAMMALRGQVDAIVSGATASASSALRPLFQILPRQEGVQTASSLLILEVEEHKPGLRGALFMADCGVIPEPTAEQLADIALTTAALAHHLTNTVPKVALLSFSTRGSSLHPSAERVRAATVLARAKASHLGLEVEIDGELQADAALEPHIAQLKNVDGPVAGQANVLVFPDLNSGNIASKLVQITTGANAYGQIITGLSRPAAEISRGASAHDILGIAAIVGCQAIEKRLLYSPEAAQPEEGTR